MQQHHDGLIRLNYPMSKASELMYNGHWQLSPVRQLSGPDKQERIMPNSNLFSSFFTHFQHLNALSFPSVSWRGPHPFPP